jgi:hypothetical protein
MVLRIRFASGKRERQTRRQSARFVVAVCSLLQPVALVVWCVAAWRLGVDLGWASRFPIASGSLSHWQVWIAIAFTIQFTAYVMQRFIPTPDDDEEQLPQRSSGMAA